MTGARTDAERTLAHWTGLLAAYDERPHVVFGERYSEDRIPFARDYWALVGEPRKLETPIGGAGSGMVAVTTAYGEGTFGPGEDWERLPAALRDSMRALEGLDPHVGEFQVTGWEACVLPRWTDRGVVDLPGWRVSFAAFGHALPVLDVATPPGVMLVDMHQAYRGPAWWIPDGFVSADGLTLTARFLGYDEAFYDYPLAEVLESHDVVAFEAVGQLRPGVGYVEDSGQLRSVTFSLEAPLGERVVACGTRYPLIIAPDSTRASYPSWPSPPT